MHITPITDNRQKAAVARLVLEALPEWFGIPESLEAYIADSAGKPFFCAMDGDAPVGFLYLMETGAATVELAVMGVMKTHHRHGAGRGLVEAARAAAREAGYEAAVCFIVQMEGMKWLEPNDATHPQFGETLRRAARAGVEVFALECETAPGYVKAVREIPVKL